MSSLAETGGGWKATRWLGAAALALLALAASVVPDLGSLEPSALAGGELWRLWTGHLVHASRAHFAFDVGVAALLVAFFRLRWALLWMPLLVSLGLFVCYPDLEHYYGLSGVLHGLVVLIAGRIALRERGFLSFVGWGLVAGTLAKAVVETATGGAVFTSGIDMGGPVLYGAHLVGAVVGGLGLIPSVIAEVGSRRRLRPPQLDQNAVFLE